MNTTIVLQVNNLARNARMGWAFFLRLLLFWLLFFAVFRLFFILWLRSEWAAEHPWPALWKALPLDLSMAGYLLAVPVLFWFAGLALGNKGRPGGVRLINGFTILVFAFLVFVFGSNVFIYQEWHTPLNSRALEYFKTPAAMLDSMSAPFKLFSLAAYSGLMWLWWRVYRRMVGDSIYPEEISRWQSAWLPVQMGILFLFIRGGIGVMPVNESAVYYSPHLFNNHAATNTAWHLIHSMIETRQTQNPYRFMPDALARERTKQFLKNKTRDTPPHNWLKTSSLRPNLVFILMESMTAQVVEELGGEKGVCPNLSRLAQEGILFERCYSSGYRTDQGLVSILGGYPAQPNQSIVLLQDKAAKLPSVPKVLKNAGYQTAFFYGGELTFANIGVWLRHQQFDHIFSEKDFAGAEITQRWGADDDLVFKKALHTLRQMPQPFFSSILTLSLHPPFDVPFESRWSGPSEPEMFLNSAAFADYAIGEFFKAASREPWYTNTLFVLVADHGHSGPNQERMDAPRARQIPILLTGPLIEPGWRSKRIGTIGNHHDIPATILEELGLPSHDFTWSKDLMLTGCTPFAYYTNENGLGWIDPDGAGFYQFQQKSWKVFSGSLDTAACTNAQAYLQALYNEFLAM